VFIPTGGTSPDGLPLKLRLEFVDGSSFEVSTSKVFRSLASSCCPVTPPALSKTARVQEERPTGIVCDCAVDCPTEPVHVPKSSPAEGSWPANLPGDRSPTDACECEPQTPPRPATGEELSACLKDRDAFKAALFDVLAERKPASSTVTTTKRTVTTTTTISPEPSPELLTARAEIADLKKEVSDLEAALAAALKPCPGNGTKEEVVASEDESLRAQVQGMGGAIGFLLFVVVSAVVWCLRVLCHTELAPPKDLEMATEFVNRATTGTGIEEEDVSFRVVEQIKRGEEVKPQTTPIRQQLTKYRSQSGAWWKRLRGRE
jgi:hypothetical protein